MYTGSGKVLLVICCVRSLGYYRSDERIGIAHIISVVKRVELVISKPLQWLKVVLGPRSLPSDGIIPLLFSWKCVLVRPDTPKEYE